MASVKSFSPVLECLKIIFHDYNGFIHELLINLML